MKYINDFGKFSEVLNEIKFSLTSDDPEKIKKIKKSQMDLGITQKIPAHYEEIAKEAEADNYSEVLKLVLENQSDFKVSDFMAYYTLDYKGKNVDNVTALINGVMNTITVLLLLYKTPKAALKILTADLKKGETLDTLLLLINKFNKDGKVTKDEVAEIIGFIQNEEDEIALDYQTLLRAAKEKGITDGLSKLVQAIIKYSKPLFQDNPEAGAKKGLEQLRLKINMLFLAKLKKGVSQSGPKESGWKGALYFNYKGVDQTIGGQPKQILQSLLDKKIITANDIEKFSSEIKGGVTYYIVQGNKVTLIPVRDEKGVVVMNDKGTSQLNLRTASGSVTTKAIVNMLTYGSAKNKVKADSIEFKPPVPKPKGR